VCCIVGVQTLREDGLRCHSLSLSLTFGSDVLTLPSVFSLLQQEICSATTFYTWISQNSSRLSASTFIRLGCSLWQCIQLRYWYTRTGCRGP